MKNTEETEFLKNALKSLLIAWKTIAEKYI